jgi:hypothetical protein
MADRLLRRGSFRLAVFAMATALPIGCTASPVPPTSPTATLPIASPTTAAPDLVGTFDGLPYDVLTCAWLVTAEGNVHVDYPLGWEYAYAPIRLVNPDGEVVADAGDVISLRGHFLDERIGFCRGPATFDWPAFEASEVLGIERRPAGSPAATP